jgi:hypothetical protein
MQQAGYFESDPPFEASSLRADITPFDTELNSIRLSRLTENSPPMPLNPAAVSAAYTVVLAAPGAGGVGHIEHATISRSGGNQGNGRDPRPDEWTDSLLAPPATATHWRFVLDTPSGNPSPLDEWSVSLRNNTWPALVGLWAVHGGRLIARGTYYGDLIGDEETLTYLVDPGSVYHIQSGGLIDWTADVAVRDRIFITFAAFDEANSSLNLGVYTIKEIIDANNVIVYEPFEAGGPGDFNILVVQKATA